MKAFHGRFAAATAMLVVLSMGLTGCGGAAEDGATAGTETTTVKIGIVLR